MHRIASGLGLGRRIPATQDPAPAPPSRHASRAAGNDRGVQADASRFVFEISLNSRYILTMVVLDASANPSSS